MTPFVTFPDGAQVELLFHLFGEVVENRLWFLNRTPPNSSINLLALAEGVRDWHTTHVLPLLSNELELFAVLATDWSVPAGGVQSASLSPTPGGYTSLSYSASVAVRVVFRLSSDKRYTNANFVPGIPLNEVDGNVINPSYAAALRFAYADLIDLAPVFGPFPAWRWVGTSAWLGNTLRTEMDWGRVDFPYVRSPWVSPRRKRLPSAP